MTTKAFKDKARSLVSVAIKKGVLKRLPCIVCGAEKSEGHHEDYNKPLEVVWLCKLHHTQVHINDGTLARRDQARVFTKNTSRPTLKRYTIMIDEATVSKAQEIAEGNLSRGLRLAVKRYPAPKLTKGVTK